MKFRFFDSIDHDMIIAGMQQLQMIEFLKKTIRILEL